MGVHVVIRFVYLFKQKTAYEMRISDWSSDVCSSDLRAAALDIVNSQSGFEIMAEVNARIAAMIARAEGVLREDTDDADRATVMLFAVQTIGLFVIATLAVISLSVLRRSARETRSEEHTSELQSLMRNSYAVFCLKKTNQQTTKI